jgi:hypothetical protein
LAAGLYSDRLFPVVWGYRSNADAHDIGTQQGGSAHAAVGARIAKMNQWGFVIGAYALTFSGTVVLCLSCWRSMRNAEAAAQRLSDKS